MKILPANVREKTEGLSFKEKVIYIWSYYWIPILAVVLSVVALGYIIYNISGAGKRYEALTVVLINAYNEDTDATIFDEMVDAEEEYNSVDDMIYVDQNYDIALDDSDNKATTTYEVLGARFLVGDMDLFVSERYIFKTFADDKGFLDLRTLFSAEEMEKYEDIIIWVEDSKTGEEIPCGIWLDETSTLHKAGYYEVPVVAGIVSQARDIPFCYNVLIAMIGDFG